MSFISQHIRHDLIGKNLCVVQGHKRKKTKTNYDAKAVFHLFNNTTKRCGQKPAPLISVHKPDYAFIAFLTAFFTAVAAFLTAFFFGLAVFSIFDQCSFISFLNPEISTLEASFICA